MMLFRREVIANLKSLFIWSGGMVFLILAGMGKYEAGAQGGPGSMEELFLGMPDSLKNIFGIGVFDLSRAIEYYGILFIYIALMLSLHAVFIGSGIIAKEERDKTADFLLVKPISRNRILAEKLAAALVIQLILWSITFATSYALLAHYSQGDGFFEELLALMGAGLFLQILFLFFGAFWAGILTKPKRAAAVSSAILLLMFVIKIVSDLSESVQPVGYLSFFRYFDAKDILIRGYSPIHLLFPGICCCGFLFFAFRGYRRRDIHS